MRPPTNHPFSYVSSHQFDSTFSMTLGESFGRCKNELAIGFGPIDQFMHQKIVVDIDQLQRIWCVRYVQC